MSNVELFSPQASFPTLWDDADIPSALLEAAPLAHKIVVGGPASGKTTLLRTLVKKAEVKGVNPDDILILTPSRISASSLRDQIAIDSGLASSGARARSVSALAFSIVREVDPDMGLLSGANQELLVSEILQSGIEAGLYKSWGFDLLTVGLKGFRAELRDLINVAQENQLDLAAIEGLQHRYPEAKYKILTDVLPKYQELLRTRHLVDPSTLLIAAFDILRNQPTREKLIFVDDAQELSTAALSLISELGKNNSLVIFGDPDLATQGFRTGDAGQFMRLFESAAKIFLASNVCLPSGVADIGIKLSSKLPASLAGPQRRAYSNPLADAGNVMAQVFPDKSSESDYLALQLRKIRLEESIDWNSMAIVARTRNQLEQIASDLASRSVPTRILGIQKPLRENYAAGAILAIAKAASAVPDLELITRLLHSDFCGLDAIGVRRLGRQLATLEQFDGLNFAQTMSAAFEGEIEYDSPEVRKLNQIVRLVAKAKGALDATAHQLVSLIWEAGPGKKWEILSRGASETAMVVNRDLDSVLELFAAAIRFDQNLEGNALDFVLHQLDLAIPEDSLAPVGQRSAVTLATPAQLIGACYEVVALPRLQEGIWPNLKRRNSLLGAASLSAYLSGRLDSPLEATKSELADEIRMFLKSATSTRSTLLLSCISDAEEQPSQFFPLMGIEPVQNSEAMDFDLRRKVGRLRFALSHGDLSAAPVLAALAIAGAPGAHPKNWQGLQDLSTLEPIIDPDSQVRISASKLEAFERCPLHWFASTFGADSGGFEASLGTLIHAALEMAQVPSDLNTYVESNWHTLQFETAWQEAAQKRKALNMVALVAQYLSEAGNLVSAEQGFKLEVGRLLISGKIDRIEQYADGSMVAVDLKTGKTPTLAEASKNRQIALYQLSLKQLYPDAASSSGRLVYVGGDKLKVMNQEPLEDERLEGLQGLMREVEKGAGGSVFSALLDEHCAEDSTCKLLIGRVITGG